MITNFKNFGKLDEGELEEGDYVLMKSLSGALKNKIGQVLRIRRHYDEIDVEYEEPRIKKMFGLNLNDVEHWSSDKEKLEMLINSEKYNI
jgi:hypothetical protein